MSAAGSQGMSDEQVEELLEALLEFRELLMGLNDRFQSRMALLEQEFAERRAAVNLPPKPKEASPAPVIERKSFQSAASAALAELDPEAESEAEEEVFDILDDEDAFDPDEEDSFSIVDFDDDDDF